MTTNSPSLFDDYVSTSDQAEQERFAKSIAGAEGLGDVLVSYEDDFRELGILNE